MNDRDWGLGTMPSSLPILPTYPPNLSSSHPGDYWIYPSRLLFPSSPSRCRRGANSLLAAEGEVVLLLKRIVPLKGQRLSLHQSLYLAVQDGRRHCPHQRRLHLGLGGEEGHVGDAVYLELGHQLAILWVHPIHSDEVHAALVASLHRPHRGCQNLAALAPVGVELNEGGLAVAQSALQGHALLLHHVQQRHPRHRLRVAQCEQASTQHRRCGSQDLPEGGAVGLAEATEQGGNREPAVTVAVRVWLVKQSCAAAAAAATTTNNVP
mmetsp:Transcript_28627/g.63520  ORF Transcript_28627/g.63520 Transcript_28627/m.63520 type:complete len:266 (-) Transcript_28627:198-995(-)